MYPTQTPYSDSHPTNAVDSRATFFMIVQCHATATSQKLEGFLHDLPDGAGAGIVGFHIKNDNTDTWESLEVRRSLFMHPNWSCMALMCSFVLGTT
jgi:hypothetical protein